METVEFDLKNALFPNLPAYPAEMGNMSPVLYNAGDGCYDHRRLTAPDEIPFFRDGMRMTDAEWTDTRTALDRAHIPHHPIYVRGGYMGLWLYYHRRLIEVINRNGVISAMFIDTHMPHPRTPVFVRTVTETDANAFFAYLETLTEVGCVKRYTYQSEQNQIAEFSLPDGALLHATYIPGDRTARFAYDRVSVPIDLFGDGASADAVHGNGKTEVYQYGLYYSGMRSGFSCDCGMCYLIKLPDNSLFFVDGGECEQATEAAVTELWALMHRITETPLGETIHISGYFCTHAHDDHMDLFAHLLGKYRAEIDLQRVLFNFCADEFVPLCPQTFVLINRIRAYYPSVMYRKVHMGDRFSLAGVTFDILQTHEDATGKNGDERIGGFNDTSTVLKVSFDGKSFLILGDIDDSAEAVLLAHYTRETLHTDIVQCAHHLFNRLERVYDVIDADYAFVPQDAACKTNHNSQKYGCVARTVPEEHFFFAASGTDGLRVDENGALAHHYHEPAVGGVYDGNPL